MKLSNEERDILYHLVIAIIFGCALMLLGGCDKRMLTDGSGQQKADGLIDSRNAAVDQIATKINQASGDTKEAVEFTSERRGINSEGAPLDDASITQSVKAALRRDPRLTPVNLDVATVNGEVTLKGEVTSSELRMRMENVVASVTGVVKVNNFIRINWNQ